MIVSKLNHNDLGWCLRRAPKQVLELMKEHPKLIVAGGFVRSCIANEKINDMDLFCDSPEAADVYAKALAKGTKIFKTGNAYTVSRKRGVSVQFIHRWSFANALSLLESFDFSIACGAFWYDKGWQSLAHNRFYQDLAAKRLVYQSPKRNEDAGGSMLRVLKFYQRGYRIPLDSMGAVIARMIQPLDKHRACTESEQARVLTGLLREVDPAIDPTHIAHLPSESESV